MKEKFAEDINENDIDLLMEAITQFEIFMYLNHKVPWNKILRDKQEHAIVLKGKLFKVRDRLEVERNLKKGV